MEDLSPAFLTKLSMMGNELLLRQVNQTFLCSHRVPDTAFAPIRNWVRSLSLQHDCVMIGALAGMERFVLRLLVEHRIPVVVVLAEALPKQIEDVSIMVPDVELSKAMGEGRLLVLSANSDEEDVCATAANAALRNQWMMDYARQIIVGYVSRQGRLFQQLKGRTGIHVLCAPQD